MSSRHHNAGRICAGPPANPWKQLPGCSRGAACIQSRHPAAGPPLSGRDGDECAWPLCSETDAARREAVGTGSLEPVGLILQRLELDRLDLVRLRAETRCILAGLAA